MYLVKDNGLMTTGFSHSEISRLKLIYQLTEAYRRLSRPSSPSNAKASVVCTYSLDHITPKYLLVPPTFTHFLRYFFRSVGHVVFTTFSPSLKKCLEIGQNLKPHQIWCLWLVFHLEVTNCDKSQSVNSLFHC